MPGRSQQNSRIRKRAAALSGNLEQFGFVGEKISKEGKNKFY